MKRLLIMLVCIFMLIPVNLKAENQTVTAIGSGFTNVQFSNGYYGYCIDEHKSGAYAGDEFTVLDTTSANHNPTGTCVSQELKVLFTQCFEDIFVSDGNGNYKINNDSTVQSAIWNITDDRYIWGEQKTLVNDVKSYTGNSIPDEGYQKVLSNGDIITFYFMLMSPKSDTTQAFFAYKLVVKKELEHVHTFSEQWEIDDIQHWKECECGEKQELDDHKGGKATCISKKECTTCGKEYGTFNSTNHTGNTELRNAKPATTNEEGYTGDTYCKDCNTLLEKGSVIEKLHEHEFGDWEVNDEQHWKECECDEKSDLGNHEGGEATCISKKKCSVCGEEYGTFNSTKHTGNTELRNAKPATTEEEGYTGDTYCKACNALIKKGTALSKLGEAPNTGDNSNILLWTFTMITSATCCLLLAIKKYKNN